MRRKLRSGFPVPLNAPGSGSTELLSGGGAGGTLGIGSSSTREISAEEDQIRRTICEILLKEVGHDFSGYKEKMFMRRVRSRMQALQLTSLSRYLERLHDEPCEAQLLFRDILIGATDFFRDVAAFEALAAAVIPKLFEGKGAHDTLRIWVPGCATGEEAYSIAILMREHMEGLRAPPKVKIFATDIDEAALGIARLGHYPAELMDNIAPQRLQRFFIAGDGTYLVSKDIRAMCIFSAHSIVRDPPFSDIDLISCRNLLIYFGVDFQAQAMPVFCSALKSRGFLFLGAFENIATASDLFLPVDKKHRIFQRRDHVVALLSPRADAEGGRSASRYDENSDTIECLEQELRETRERMQATIEEYETAVEKLRSSNDELRSLNEALEIVREELQSANEELRTVNSVLNAKIEELGRVNAKLKTFAKRTQNSG